MEITQNLFKIYDLLCKVANIYLSNYEYVCSLQNYNNIIYGSLFNAKSSQRGLERI